MHKVAPEIEAAIDIPLLHIADATAAKLQADGITRVGLLGTRFTMEQDFYKGRLQERFGLAVLVPDEAGRERVHRIIYDELCLGEIRESSRAEYLAIIEELAAAGGRGGDPRLYRDCPAGGGCPGGGAALRHHCHPCRSGGRAGTGN